MDRHKIQRREYAQSVAQLLSALKTFEYYDELVLYSGWEGFVRLGEGLKSLQITISRPAGKVHKRQRFSA